MTWVHNLHWVAVNPAVEQVVSELCELAIEGIRSGRVLTTLGELISAQEWEEVKREQGGVQSGRAHPKQHASEHVGEDAATVGPMVADPLRSTTVRIHPIIL